jgi:hypothetical protein
LRRLLLLFLLLLLLLGLHAPAGQRRLPLLLLQGLIAKGIPFRILVLAEPPTVSDNSIRML